MFFIPGASSWIRLIGSAWKRSCLIPGSPELKPGRSRVRIPPTSPHRFRTRPTFTEGSKNRIRKLRRKRKSRPKIFCSKTGKIRRKFRKLYFWKIPESKNFGKNPESFVRPTTSWSSKTWRTENRNGIPVSRGRPVFPGRPDFRSGLPQVYPDRIRTGIRPRLKWSFEAGLVLEEFKNRIKTKSLKI